VTGWNVFDEYNKLFLVKHGIAFYSDDAEKFSYFQGWKYNLVSKYDINEIQGWLSMVHDVIANGNEELYQYLLNWVAFILQNVGVKTTAFLVLKGQQGVGKGRFTDIISELMAGYSRKNVNNIEDITGHFTAILLNKVLVVVGEMDEAKDEKRSVFDRLKDIDTEDRMTVKEKCVPKFEANNVVNLIVSTNNEVPVFVEKSDRRYVICDCNPKYLGNQTFWDELSAKTETKDHHPIKSFYNTLFTYFMNRDISSFNPRRIIHTEAKTKLIKRSLSAVDTLILERYEEFKNGIAWNDIRYKWKELGFSRVGNFKFSVEEKCVYEKKQIDGVGAWRMILKKELYSSFDKLVEREDGICEDE
jgi:hypothetical protein